MKPTSNTLSLRKGPISRPQKAVLYGPEGVGKSTLAAGMPDPVILGTEGGTHPGPACPEARVDTARRSMTTSPDTTPVRIPTLLTTDQLAEHLRCSGRTICRMRERGLPTIHVGVLVRFDLEEVRRWLDAKSSAARCATNQSSSQ